jgi:hypothetical protein
MIIISISSVASGSLAVLSYLKATQQAGTTQDADFFSLIQNSLVQIFSIWTMMLTLRKTRLKMHARIYTWFLAAFGLLAAAVAVPMYVLIPTGWSTLLSAASGNSAIFRHFTTRLRCGYLIVLVAWVGVKRTELS